MWQSNSGIIYWQNDFGTFIRQTPYEMILSLDEPVNVMTRNHSDFGKLKDYAMNKAVSYMKSNHPKLFSPSFEEINDIFTYDFSAPNHREITKNKLSWNILE